MHYKVLANKWRPKNFSEIIGQTHITQSLKNILLNNKLHHAYILSGTRGIGKTTVARLFAKSLNCKKSYLSCNNCNNCNEIEKNCFIDLIEIDAASRTKVEDIRDLLDTVKYLPVKGNYKIYLIDEIHMLSKYSFNALLKTLEEPPKHVKFFLITTELQKLPLTILSRCIQLNFKPINTNLIIQKLQYIFSIENITANQEILKLIAKSAKGSMRDALTLTDQIIALDKNIKIENINLLLGICNENYVIELVECIVDHDINKLIKVIDLISHSHVEWDNVLLDMLHILHKITIYNIFINNNSLDKIKSQKYKNLSILNIAKKMSFEEIQLYYKIIISGRKELSFSSDDKSGVEMIIFRILLLKKIFKKNKLNSTIKDYDLLNTYTKFKESIINKRHVFDKQKPINNLKKTKKFKKDKKLELQKSLNSDLFFKKITKLFE